MENRTDSSGMVGYVLLIIFLFAFITEFGFLGMIVGYVLMTSYMNNFVLRPLSKIISAQNYTPNNYMYSKLQSTRLVVWIISAILGFSFLFVIENIALAISISKINEIKKKLGIPLKRFSRHDYLIYDEYWKYSEDDEYNEYEANTGYDYDKTENKLTEEVEKVIKTEILDDKEALLRKEIEVLKKEIDLDKITKSNTTSIWDEPIGSVSSVFNTSIEEKKEPTEDEICCEKCGTVMSKMKIACPKCGTLVKNSYGNRK